MRRSIEGNLNKITLYYNIGSFRLLFAVLLAPAYFERPDSSGVHVDPGLVNQFRSHDLE